jgi:hypothetical protein
MPGVFASSGSSTMSGSASLASALASRTIVTEQVPCFVPLIVSGDVERTSTCPRSASIAFAVLSATSALPFDAQAFAITVSSTAAFACTSSQFFG